MNVAYVFFVLCFAARICHADTANSDKVLWDEKSSFRYDAAINKNKSSKLSLDSSAVSSAAVESNNLLGGPVSQGNLTPKVLVTRNQRIIVYFKKGGLEIFTEGRSLEQGDSGQVVKILNLSSKNTITATIISNGSAVIGNEGTGGE